MTPLRRRMIEDMRIRNLAPQTQRAYVQQISRFARHFGRSPALLGPADIHAYQLHLVQDRQLSASSILVAVAALRFLYKITLKRHWSIEEVVPTCRKPQRLPVVLSRDEVNRFLDAVELRKHRVILTVCYAAGLRISEAVRLTPGAIDSQRMVIRIDEGKGRKDRYVMLAPDLLDLLRQWWRVKRPRGWLFPGQQPVQPITARQLNRACHAAAQAAKLDKRISMHTLRHSFATHLLERHTDIRVIQVLLGHRKLDSTALYTRVALKTIREVPSPLALLASPPRP